MIVLRVRWTPIALLIACGTARSPVAPSSPGDLGRAAAGPPRSGEPAQVAAATSADAGPADAAHTASCREGTYDHPNPDAVFSHHFHALSSGGSVCDLRDRIIIVDGRAVTVFTRPGLKKTRAPITRSQKLDDRCGGPGGGHAGCSITFRRFWSAALGTGYVEFGTNVGNVLVDGADPDKVESCREDSPLQVIATCSTAEHFVMVKYQEEVYDDPAYRGPPCWHLHARVWDLADQSADFDGDIDRAASVGEHLVFRFPAGAAADRAITLGFDGQARTATLEVGGAREPCIAFRMSP